MKIECLKKPDGVLVKVTGDLDQFTFPLFEEEIILLNRMKVPSLELDLRKCQAISLKAIRFLSNLEEMLVKTDRSLTVHLLPSKAQELLALMIRGDLKIILSHDGRAE